MSDSYQAIYDAVRSRISGGNVSDAVERAARDTLDASHAIACLHHEFSLAAYEMARPSTVLRPGISIDGNKWCALYGANLQDGVAGFGDSPAEAFADFDKAWNAKLTVRTTSTRLGSALVWACDGLALCCIIAAGGAFFTAAWIAG